MSAAAATALETPAMDNDFIAFVGDDVTRAAVAQLATQQGWPEERIVDGGILEAVDRLRDVATPRRMLIDLAGTDDPLAAVNTLAKTCDSGTRVVALGTINDVTLYRALRALGVDDYLIKPVTPDQLESALAQAAPISPEAGATTEAAAELYLICGVRGGIGASTTALNIAWVLAHEWQRRVALADLDLQFGAASLFLDLEPGTGLLEALANPARIDDLFMERAMVHESENLALVSAEEPLDHAPFLDGDAYDILIRRFKHNFERVVVDVPRTTLCGVPGLLEAATALVVISDLSLAGMRDSLRLADAARSAVPGLRILFAASRAGENKKAELQIKDFERGVGQALDVVVPWDPKALTAAAGAAKAVPQVAGRSPAAAAIRKLAVQLSGESHPKKRGMFKRILRR